MATPSISSFWFSNKSHFLSCHENFWRLWALASPEQLVRILLSLIQPIETQMYLVLVLLYGIVPIVIIVTIFVLVVAARFWLFVCFVQWSFSLAADRRKSGADIALP